MQTHWSLWLSQNIVIFQTCKLTFQTTEVSKEYLNDRYSLSVIAEDIGTILSR